MPLDNCIGRAVSIHKSLVSEDELLDGLVTSRTGLLKAPEVAQIRCVLQGISVHQEHTTLCLQLLCALQEFVPVARELEKNWTRFSPHYIVWVCPWVYRQSDECKSQCIHEGRYCTPDPDGDLENGYTGADVVQVWILCRLHS